MPAKYTVVRYVPNPIADEAINIGLIAYDDDEVAAQFLHRWDRVRHFSNEDTSFLESFAQRVKLAADEAEIRPLRLDSAFTPERISAYAGEWKNSIQFTSPRASLLGPQELIDQLAGRMLSEDAPAGRRVFRTRRHAARVALVSVRTALGRLGDEDAELVHSHHKLQGKFEEHSFDVVVENGKPYFAAQGLSFESDNLKRVTRQLDATKWSVDDVQKRHHGIPVGIVALLPASAHEGMIDLYRQSKEVFKELGANLIDEGEALPWARRAAELSGVTAIA